jgi:hypothetical protein
MGGMENNNEALTGTCGGRGGGFTNFNDFNWAGDFG